MATFKILAGDFTSGTGHGSSGGISVPNHLKPWKLVHIPKDEIDDIVIANEATIRKAGGTAAWGAAGGLLLGPAGLLAGAFFGGKSKKTAFIITFTDGRKLLGECKSKDFAKILAAKM